MGRRTRFLHFGIVAFSGRGAPAGEHVEWGKRGRCGGEASPLQRERYQDEMMRAVNSIGERLLGFDRFWWWLDSYRSNGSVRDTWFGERNHR